MSGERKTPFGPRYPEPPLFDDVERECPCGALIDGGDSALCRRCIEASDVPVSRCVVEQPCVLCGHATDSPTSVCRSCANDPVFREWSDPKGRRA